MRAGKLVLAKRHNWISFPGSGVPETDVVSEVRYEGPDGRVSERQTRYAHQGMTYVFDMSLTYDTLGNVATLVYPKCRHTEGGCSSEAPSRTVEYDYTLGFIIYQGSGMLHEVHHSNGVTYTMEIDGSNGLERPHRITTSAGWNTGIYRYDGVANVTQIGSRLYRYDRLNRLVSGQVQVGANLRTQSMTYDVFGSMTSMVTNGSTLSTPTDPDTNRLQSPLANHDGAGNMTRLDFGSEEYDYTYDSFNTMKTLESSGGLKRVFVYDVDGDRLARFDCSEGSCDFDTSEQTWAIRGPGGEVLRVYRRDQSGQWTWSNLDAGPPGDTGRPEELLKPYIRSKTDHPVGH